MRGHAFLLLAAFVVAPAAGSRFHGLEMFDRFDPNESPNAFYPANKLVASYFKWHTDTAVASREEVRPAGTVQGKARSSCNEVKALVYQPADPTNLGMTIKDFPAVLEMAMRCGRMLFIDWEWKGRRATDFFDSRIELNFDPRVKEGTYTAEFDWKAAQDAGTVCEEAIKDAAWMLGGVPKGLSAGMLNDEKEGALHDHDGFGTDLFEVTTLASVFIPTDEVKQLMERVMVPKSKSNGFLVVVAPVTGWDGFNRVKMPYLSEEAMDLLKFDKCVSTMQYQAVERIQARPAGIKGNMLYYIVADNNQAIETMKQNKDIADDIVATSLTSEDKPVSRWVDFFLYGEADAVLFSHKYLDAEVGSKRGGAAVLRSYAINSNDCCASLTDTCDKRCKTAVDQDYPPLACDAVLVQKTRAESAVWTQHRPASVFAQKDGDWLEVFPFGDLPKPAEAEAGGAGAAEEL